ncbi:hypothetical protein DdX_19562 [Ditylenchus destructor]|uniref:Uncharacterized protein n=1 Tax=Ditylenchus destructor TaxID=166010 RepID=A0AAD4QS97_9BILA|nr:hypothetical protein DdX_19562 [Ditylenchus destructor]
MVLWACWNGIREKTTFNPFVMTGGIYLRYMNFGENLIILLSQLITITLFSNLIYQSQFRRNSTLPRDGLWMSAYITADPLLVLMLTVERCISLQFPTYSFSITESRKKYVKPAVLIIMLILTAAAVGANTFVYLLELPLDLKRVSNCELFACLMIKSRSLPQFVWKSVTSCANLLTCFTFLYLLRNSTSAKIIKNRVVKATMLFEVCFNAIPGIAGYLFVIIVGETPANYVGQYAVMLCYVNALCSSVFYSKLMLRRRNCTPAENTLTAIPQVNIHMQSIYSSH